MDSSKECEHSSEVDTVQCENNTEVENKQISEVQETDIKQENESKTKNILVASSEDKENDSDSRQNKQDTLVTKNGNKGGKEGIGMSPSVDQSNVHYEGDICIYTDPETKNQYQWDDSKQEWTERNPANTNYKFDGQTYVYTDSSTSKYSPVVNFSFMRYLPFYMYLLTYFMHLFVEVTYQWDKDTNSWKKKDDGDRKSEETALEHKENVNQSVYGYEGDTHTYTDPTDGTVYFWDKEKSAWFPKVSQLTLFLLELIIFFFITSSNNAIVHIDPWLP